MSKILFLVSILLLGCEHQGTDLSSEPPPLSVEDTVREVVFRYQFDNNVSSQQQATKVYFLSVLALNDSTGYWDNGNPGNELLQHFADNVPPVKSFARCSVSGEGVFDLETGERGLLFRLGVIRWVAADELEIDGGYFETGISASGNTYYLIRKDGQWTVTKDVMHWIS